jgi:hypothetical protein
VSQFCKFHANIIPNRAEHVQNFSQSQLHFPSQTIHNLTQSHNSHFLSIPITPSLSNNSQSHFRPNFHSIANVTPLRILNLISQLQLQKLNFSITIIGLNLTVLVNKKNWFFFLFTRLSKELKKIKEKHDQCNYLQRKKVSTARFWEVLACYLDEKHESRGRHLKKYKV